MVCNTSTHRFKSGLRLSRTSEDIFGVFVIVFSRQNVHDAEGNFHYPKFTGIYPPLNML